MAKYTARNPAFEADIQEALRAAVNKHGVEPLTLEYSLFWSLAYLLAGYPDDMRKKHAEALGKSLPEQVEIVRRTYGFGKE